MSRMSSVRLNLRDGLIFYKGNNETLFLLYAASQVGAYRKMNSKRMSKASEFLDLEN